MTGPLPLPLRIADMNREQAIEALAQLESAWLVYRTGKHGNNARVRRHYQRRRDRIVAHLGTLAVASLVTL